ncbi:DMT family transporter [uncultured Propionivibrio sp.]|uniref:DMT family transporter n=1 Tax=uncultured Propionivibrio sp. TaxID=426737 RepID=UPI0029C0FE40|nr:DMT family transporter [uncultured Propionivibrio sp.]
MTDNRHLFQGYLAAIATLLMWSAFSLVSRLGGKSVLTPYDVYALRVVTAAAVLIPFIGRLPKGAWKDGRLWLLTTLCSLIYCPLVYSGFKYAPAAHGGILLAGLQPLLISIVVWMFTGKRPTRARSIGLLLITGGIVCAAVPYFNAWSPDSAFGDLLIFLSSVSWAIYSVLAARWGYPVWGLTCAIAFGSLVAYLPIYTLFLPKALAAAPLSAIVTQGLYQGIFATILAMLTYLKAISILGAERCAPLLALVPIVIGLVAVPLLDEPLTGWLMAGLVLVSGGALVAARQKATL